MTIERILINRENRQAKVAAQLKFAVIRNGGKLDELNLLELIKHNGKKSVGLEVKRLAPEERDGVLHFHQWT